MHQVQCLGDHLLVRELDPGDVDAVHAIYGEPKATEHLSFDPRTRDQVERIVARSIEAAHADERHEYVRPQHRQPYEPHLQDGHPAAEDGSCATTGAAVTTSSYDSADRLLTAGYIYDAFGRTTATGTGSANTYWANDLVASQTAGDTRQSWTLDPAQRFEAFTTEKKQADGTWANSTSKLNHYGDDSDEPRWIIEDTTQGTLTRNVSGPDGDLTATTSPPATWSCSSPTCTATCPSPSTRR